MATTPTHSTLPSPSDTSDATSDALLARIDVLLQYAMPSGDYQREVDGPLSIDAPIALIDELRAALVDRDEALAKMQQKSEALARAQADAIVHSAEMIDELERTRQHLSDARSAAERAAADTKRLADTVFERTNDGVLVFCDGKCIACNDNAIELLQSSREELLGSWPQAFEAAIGGNRHGDADNLREVYSRVTPSAPRQVEVQLPSADGATYWAEVTMSAFAMNDARHLLAVVRDITARKEFETELQRHRDFLDNIINAVPDHLSVTTADRTLVLANDAYCSGHGVDRSEIIGRNAVHLHAKDNWHGICELQDQVTHTGDCITSEEEVLQPDGTRRLMSVKRSALSGDAHRGYIVATARDITEDRAREDRLRLLASVFNGAAEGVAILSPCGQICEANPAFLAMAGDRRQLPDGMQLTDAMAFEVGDIGAILEEVAAGTSWSGKAHQSENGRRSRHFWVSLSPSCETTRGARRVVALVSDITELEHAQEQLRSQALYDSLTGLPNRPHFRDHLLDLVDDLHDSNRQFAVCFIDLDDFKHVNDSAGHAVGDALLCGVAERLQQVLGEEAFVARFGGDEFAMILPSDDPSCSQLRSKLDELIEAFRRPFHLGDTEAVVGLSIGVTHCPAHAQEVGALMCHADIAMYAAKSAGKNQIRVFSPELEHGVNTRHQVQTMLRRALKGGDITLCYQPKICAKTGQPMGCEALARWKSTDGSYIAPGQFVPIAEQTGLIVPLGERVFRQAAIQAKRWFEAGQSPSIAINVSPHQLRYPHFEQQLKTILAETGADPSWFELEITECAMMENVDQAMRMIDHLAEMGFSIAIDDFGTGYSSLSYLKHFRIHTLKIDLSFVRDVTSDWQSHAVVRSIVSLGCGLGLNVVAEGVETSEQAGLLAEIGCTTLQGYYFAKPMTADEYQDWLGAYAETAPWSQDK